MLATAAGSSSCCSPSSTSGVGQFFGCTPLEPLARLIVLGWAAAGTVAAEVGPALIDRLRRRADPSPFSRQRGPCSGSLRWRGVAP